MFQMNLPSRMNNKEHHQRFSENLFCALTKHTVPSCLVGSVHKDAVGASESDRKHLYSCNWHMLVGSTTSEKEEQDSHNRRIGILYSTTIYARKLHTTLLEYSQRSHKCSVTNGFTANRGIENSSWL